ncbi:ATP-binding protein [Anaerophaga thermohalophila]|uniref:ATP-binding protein n=1 Tax=Anaerophaga thermohalophila TaxID=177400 RepID=UPI0011471FCB|nr:ATP-binding protein [Anaerophaga thermohalophila]
MPLLFTDINKKGKEGMSLYKVIFEKNPQPCILFRARLNTESRPLVFECEECNAAYRKMFGKPPHVVKEEDEVPFNWFSFLSGLWHSETEVKEEYYFNEIGTKMLITARRVENDFVVCWFTEAASSAFNQPFVGVNENVLSYSKTEENIRKLLRAVEQSPVSIVITDTRGTVEYVNPAFSELTGFSRDEIIGKNPSILKSGLVPEGDYEELWSTIESGNIWRGEFINKRKDGEFYFEWAIIAPIVNPRGEITHYVGIKQDITEKKKFEQEIIDAREKARESEILKAAFLQNMSHEIRTPMNAILGFSELAKMPGTSDEKKEYYLSIVIESTHRLLGVVDDIVDISKLEAGNLTLRSSPVRLKGFLLGLHETFKNQTVPPVKLELPVVDESLQQATISVDSSRLRQVLEKLLSNAVKFTKEGHVKFGCHQIGGAVRFFVEDTGIGIQPDMYNLIFQPFYQLDMGATRSFGGNGLGLTIASRIIEKMGSRIHVDSEPGKGSVFYFDLWPDSSDIDSLVTRENTALVGEKFRNKFCVLIAESDEVNFMLLREILIKGFGEEMINVLRASTGNQAIETCRNKSKIDLVLMNLKMPDMDGFTTAKQIKSIYPDIPILAQVASDINFDRTKLSETNCDDFVPKPVDRRVLVDKISRYIGVKQADR